MSYIIKNSTQGSIVARLTDAGRKKLSEGKLNIGLFQLGDSEMCYDCYSTLPALSSGINVLQAEHNAQNLLGFPAKNKGHVKYPLNEGTTTFGNTGNTFGPTIPQHTYEEVFNTATDRGFFEVPVHDPAQPINGGYTYFSAQTNPYYTLTSNWNVCFSALTGGSLMQLSSASTVNICGTQGYSPVTGDLLSVTYNFTSTGCSQVNYSSASPTLWYQITGGNNNTGNTAQQLLLNVDSTIPDFFTNHSYSYSALSATCAHVRVYPSFTANPMTTSSIYSSADTVSYWCDDTLSFNGCCNISTSDVKIWNMNINWTHQVAGVNSAGGTDEGVDFYGSSGYCGSKEYFGYESDNGQTFSDQRIDSYHQSIVGGTWYNDSFDNIRVVLPSEQKAVGILHYTNNTTTDFYGEKFALQEQGFNATSTIGEARNFKLHLPWLMWHKKATNGSGTGTGMGDEVFYGQTFYVDPPGFSVFPAQPHVMMAPNSNFNDDGLRYYHIWDDNIGSGQTPNRVGKCFPDYKMITIDDEELLTAMSYKSKRNWTLPAPKTERIPAGTACGSGACSTGVISTVGDTLYMTYMLDNTSGMTTGLHCNYFVHETLNPGDELFDIAFTLGPEFPYLRDFSLSGTGWEANRLLILMQRVPNGGSLDPAAWEYKDVTSEVASTMGHPLSATNIVNHTFYLTGNDYDNTCPAYSALTDYNLGDFINIPQKTPASEALELQFGDEYFFYGTLETDIMATIYEMRHVIQLGDQQYLSSTNPTWVDYNAANNTVINPKLTEIGLFDNENGFPDLMAIAKFQSPVERSGIQQFVISIDF